MSILSSGEQIAFNDDFKRAFDADARAEARNTEIDDEVEYLLKRGNECYPFSGKNIFEAMRESSDAQQVVMGAFFGVAHDHTGSDNLANHGLYVMLRNIAQEYWEKTAIVLASRSVDERLS